MGLQALLDLRRVDEEAAEPQAVAEAGEVLETAVVGETAEVAGTEPPVVADSCGCRRGVAEVALQHLRAAEPEFAVGAGRQHRPRLRIGHAHVEVGIDGDPAGAMASVDGHRRRPSGE
jgi:hypothetical protein